MGFSLKKLLEGATAQVNPFDSGKTFATVVRNQPVQSQPAKTPPPSYGSNPFKQAVNRTRDVFDANTPQDYARRSRPAPMGVPAQSYQEQQRANPSNFTKLRNVVNGTAKVVGAPVIANVDIARAGIGQVTGNQIARNNALKSATDNSLKIPRLGLDLAKGMVQGPVTIGKGLAQLSTDKQNAEKAQQNLIDQLNKQKVSLIKDVKTNGFTSQADYDRKMNYADNLWNNEAQARQTQISDQTQKYSDIDPVKQALAIADTGLTALSFGVAGATKQGAKAVAGETLKNQLQKGVGKEVATQIAKKAGGREILKQSALTGSMGGFQGAINPYIVKDKGTVTPTDVFSGALMGTALGGALPAAFVGAGYAKDGLKNLNRIKLNQKGFARSTEESPVLKKLGIVKDGKAMSVDPLESLKQEARKYKSADEFVKAKTNAYHGTNVKFDSFDPNKLGYSTGANTAKKGFFFTDNTDVARGYGEFANDKPINDLIEAANKAEKAGKWDEASRLTQEYEQLAAQYKEPVVMNTHVKLDNPLVYDAKGKGFLATDKEVSDLIDKAKADGKDGVVIKNLVDNVYTTDKPSTHTVVFDPQKIFTSKQLTDLYNQATQKKGLFKPLGQKGFGLVTDESGSTIPHIKKALGKGAPIEKTPQVGKPDPTAALKQEGKAMSIDNEKYPGLVDEILNAPNARVAQAAAETRGVSLELSDSVLSIMKNDRKTALDIINSSTTKPEFRKNYIQSNKQLFETVEEVGGGNGDVKNPYFVNYGQYGEKTGRNLSVEFPKNKDGGDIKILNSSDEQLMTIPYETATKIYGTTDQKILANKIVNGNQAHTQPQAPVAQPKVEVPQPTAPIQKPKPVDPTAALKQEALKYGSAEEFADSLNAMKYGKVTGVGQLPVSKINKTQIKALTERGLPHTDTNLKVSDFKPGRQVTQPLEVYSKGGSWVVENGNHRLAQALANGDETVPVVFKGGEGKKYSTPITDLYNQAHTQPTPKVEAPTGAPIENTPDVLGDVRPIRQFAEQFQPKNSSEMSALRSFMAATGQLENMGIQVKDYNRVVNNFIKRSGYNGHGTAKTVGKNTIADGRTGTELPTTSRQGVQPVQTPAKTAPKNSPRTSGVAGYDSTIDEIKANIQKNNLSLDEVKSMFDDGLNNQNLTKRDTYTALNSYINDKYGSLDNLYNQAKSGAPIEKTAKTVYRGGEISDNVQGKGNLGSGAYFTTDKAQADNFAKGSSTIEASLPNGKYATRTDKISVNEMQNLNDKLKLGIDNTEIKNGDWGDNLVDFYEGVITPRLEGSSITQAKLGQIMEDVTGKVGISDDYHGATQYLIFNPDRVKTPKPAPIENTPPPKSAPVETPQVGKPDPTAALKQEALKYKSAEEFVRANQSSPEIRAAEAKLAEIKARPDYQDFTKGGKITGKTWNDNNAAGVEYRNAVDARSKQLTDLYNQAHTQPTPKVEAPTGAPIEKTARPLQVQQTPFGPVKAKTDPGLDPVVNRTQKVVEMQQKSEKLLPESKPTSKMPTKDSEKASSSNNTPDQNELPLYKSHQVSNLDKAFRSTRSIIERQGEKGKQLAGMLQKQRDTKELYVREIEKQISTVQSLKGKDYENFVDATQGLAKPNNPKVAQAVKEWQSVHPGIRDRAVNAGLDVGDLGETYYPHFIDYDKIFKNKNTYNEAINHLVKTGQAETPEKAIELLSYARDVSRNRKFGNLEASRLVDLPFYDKSKASLGMYIDGSADRITKTEMFGKGDENALKLIKEAGLDGYDTEAMKNAYDVAVGAKQYNPTTSKISKGIRQFTTTTRLGLGALTNVSQSVNTGIVTGHLRTMKSIIKQFDPKTRQLAEDTGVISDAILNDLKHGFGAEYNKGKFGKVVNAITAPGFKQVESFNRRVAATAGRDYALRLAQKGDEATLRKLGVTGVIKNGTLTNSQQTQAARKIVEKTQFKVDPQDLPGWADSPGGKLVAQFRTFSYNQGKFFSNEILKPLAKGNIMPLGRLMAALPLGYGLYEIRRKIDGRPEEENKAKVGLQSFQKIGGAGLVFDIYQGLNPVGSKYLPSDRRVTMAFGTIGGPSIGTAGNAIGAISEAIQRKNTPKDESRLGGKVVVAKNDNSYTDLTAISRFGMQQVPIIGTAMANRVLPYKKQAEAEAGKPLGTNQAQTTREDQLKDAKNSIKYGAGKEWAKLTETEIKQKALDGDEQAKVVYQGMQAMEKVYAPKNIPTKGLNSTAEDILNKDKKITSTGKNAWNSKPNTNQTVKNTLKTWNNGRDVPVTNEVAKQWAEYEKKAAEGTLGKLEAVDEKKKILRNAYNSTLNEDEKDLYKLSKTRLKEAYDQGLITDANIQKALDAENKLYEAGLIDKKSLHGKLGLATGAKTSGRSGRSSRSGRSGGRKSTKKVAKLDLSSFSTYKSKRSSTNASLRKLLGSAKV